MRAEASVMRSSGKKRSVIVAKHKTSVTRGGDLFHDRPEPFLKAVRLRVHSDWNAVR